MRQRIAAAEALGSLPLRHGARREVTRARARRVGHQSSLQPRKLRRAPPVLLSVAPFSGPSVTRVTPWPRTHTDRALPNCLRASVGRGMVAVASDSVLLLLLPLLRPQAERLPVAKSEGHSSCLFRNLGELLPCCGNSHKEPEGKCVYNLKPTAQEPS